MSTVTVTKNNFESEVVNSSEPVLIDFWSETCSPCRALSPIVDEIANEAKQTKICKVDVDKNMELAKSFNIMSVPTLVYIKNGSIIDKSVGVRPKQFILSMINEQ